MLAGVGLFALAFLRGQGVRILITGGSGYIGSHLTQWLTKAGHAVTIVDSRKPPVACSNWFEGDVQAVIGAAMIAQPDAVIHLAAIAYVDVCEQYPAMAWAENVAATIAVAQQAVAQGIRRLVFASSCAVYGNCGGPVHEDAPLRPASCYGETKKAAEEALRAISSRCHLGCTALRLFNVAGMASGLPLSSSAQRRVIPRAALAGVKGREFQIYGGQHSSPDGTCVRDYVHVLDVARAFEAALSVDHEGFRAYNIGSGQGTSVGQIANMVSREVYGLEETMPRRRAMYRAGDVAQAIADQTWAERYLDWRPQLSAEDMVRSTVAWARETANAG